MVPTSRRPRRRRSNRRYRISVPVVPVVGWRLHGSGWSAAKVVSAILLGLLAIALYQLSDSYSFFVYQADIQGNRLLSSEEIYTRSGVHEGSIFWLIPTQIETRIEAHPYVKQASVHCRLPGDVRIEVIERSPRISWITDSGELWIDSEAVSLTPLTTGRPSLVLDDDDGQAGREDGGLQPGVAEGILLVSEVMPEISQFRYDRTWGLHFQKPNGCFVTLGRADRMPFKVEVLLRIEEEILARGDRPQLIDLRFPDAPYYR
jgi:cell division septal protein FtsQ